MPESSRRLNIGFYVFNPISQSIVKRWLTPFVGSRLIGILNGEREKTNHIFKVFVPLREIQFFIIKSKNEKKERPTYPCRGSENKKS